MASILLFQNAISLDVVIFNEMVYIITKGNRKYSKVRAAPNRILEKAGYTSCKGS